MKVGRDGWRPVRQAESHVALSHPDKPGTVTIPVHAGVILGPKLLSSILKQASLTPDAFRALL
jgi:predicted RNA binding protein YcfA (HicA-like mRNA interferase family)